MPKTPTAKPFPSLLARSLVAALPSAPKVIKLAEEMAVLQKQLEKEFAAAKKSGPVQAARAYVVMRRMCDRVQDIVSISDGGKVFGPMMQKLATEEMPAMFEQAGVPHISLDEGFRVGVSHRWSASIKSDKKGEAYHWLRVNGLGDLITNTVNASTLSAAVKKEVEEHNREFPDEFFNVAHVPNTSVTATGK